MKKSFFAVLLGLVLVLNSCVALLSPKQAKIKLNTSSEENELSENGEAIGKGTSVVYTLNKVRTTLHQVDVSAKGYKTSHQVIYPKGRTPIIYPVQIIYFPMIFVPSIVDFGSNNPFVYNKNVTLSDPVALPKYEVSGKRIELYEVSVDERLIDSNGVVVQVKHKKEAVLTEIKAADVAGKGIDLKGSLLSYDMQECNEAIHRYLRESGYIDTVNKVFRDNNNTIAIEGKLKKYTRYDIDVKGRFSFYKAKGEITWYLRNHYEEIIDSVIREDYSDDFASAGSQYLISDLFQNSYVELLKSDEFKEKTRAGTDFTSKEALLTVSKPKQPVRTVTDAQEASVVVKTKTGHGSGFAISNDGYLLTNYHVVAGDLAGDSTEIWIVQPGGGKLKAELVRFNVHRDIALLKVDSAFSKAFLLNDVKTHKAFQEVYTIGAPMFAELLKSYQKGTISNDRSAFGVDIIQVSMAINGGNSGGPLFDSTGKLHGVIVSKLIGFSTEGIGFAIPAHKLSEYLNIRQ